MLPEESVTLCRICLADGAQFPIFDKGDDNIYQKLSTCLHEKIEDVEGYPRNICYKCKDNLNIICDFVNTYKESCKILQYGIIIVKEEKLFNTDYNDADVVYDQDDGPNEHVETKLEVNCSDDQKCLAELINPTKVKLKTKKLPKKVRKALEKPLDRKQNKKKTYDIATCILEGNFVWNGDKWCSPKAVPKITFTDPEKQRKQRRLQRDLQRQIRKKKSKEKHVTEKLCDLCGEVFKNNDRLLVHRDKVHFPKELKCPQCPRVFRSTYFFNRHIKRKHSEKNYICAECGKEFAFLSEMNTHIKKIHKQDQFPKKVFSCSMCDKTYACQKSVTMHERSVHTGERPAVCSVCDSAFYHEEYLKEHMRLHTGETPFKCPVCSRGYAQRCNMKSHIKQHRISELNADLLSRIKPNYLRLMKP